MPKAIAKEVLGRPLEFTNGEELSNRLHQPLPPNEVSVYVLLCVGIGSGLKSALLLPKPGCNHQGIRKAVRHVQLPSLNRQRLGIPFQRS